MQLIRKFIHYVASLNTFLGKLSSYSLIIFMCILSFEVVARYFFNSPTVWAHELSGYFLTYYLALTGPWLLLTREHVYVDIVYSRYSEKKKKIADIVSNLIAIFFFSVVLFTGWKYALYSIVNYQTSHTAWGPPLWPGKIVIPVCAVLFILQSLSNICESALKIKESDSK
ncbi:MAG: TRAP transporter small permease subunit [Desulfovermiculus sp.]